MVAFSSSGEPITVSMPFSTKRFCRSGLATAARSALFQAPTRSAGRPFEPNTANQFTTSKPGRYFEITGRLGNSGEGCGEPKAIGINPPPPIWPKNSGMLPNIMSQLPATMSWMAGAPPR